jgi:glycosyltransferase involved in cell wall biosynthesis
MFGLGLSRLVPTRFRPAVVGLGKLVVIQCFRVRARARLLKQRLTPALPPNRAVAADGIVAVVGLFSMSTGLAQGARLMLNRLAASGRDVVAVDVTQLLKFEITEPDNDALNIADLAALRVADIIIHLNPPEYNRVYLALPSAVTARARIVAYWAWELERTPAEWNIAAKFCDEIWVPSAFVAQSVRAQEYSGHRRPVKVVPHAVAADPLFPRKTHDICLALRVRHGLGSMTLVGGFSFSMRSAFVRKNPLGVIAAFQQAFPVAEFADVALVIRCTDSEVYPAGLAKLRAAAMHDARIMLVDDNIRRMGIQDLYYLVDVYISLHRSEGFGLTMAEAAQVGTCVVATDWWLADDIRLRPEVETIRSRLVPVLDPQGIYRLRGCRWAEPDLTHAAAILRRHYAALRARSTT